MAKLNWSVQLVEISRSEIWYKKLDHIPIGPYESYLKLVVMEILPIFKLVFYYFTPASLCVVVAGSE